MDSRFGSVEGVVRTTVGYTGGTRKNPTYGSLGDHTESVEVEYDPSRVSYRDLLRVFWESHDPGSQAWSRQYRNALFWHTEEQRQLALETRAEVEARRGGPVRTDLEPAGRFYPAEAYHQKYALKARRELWEDLRARFPTDAAAASSTAAARINGYLGGYGRPSRKTLQALGLSPRANERLQALIGLDPEQDEDPGERVPDSMGGRSRDGTRP